MRRQLARPLQLAALFVSICWTLQWVFLFADSHAHAPSTSQLPQSSHRHSHHRQLSQQDTSPAVTATPTDTSNSAAAAYTAERCAEFKLAEIDSFINYEYLVHCTSLRDSVPWARTALVVILVLLLYLLSSTADSFFCPVLQAIVEKYRIPPDIAGVTFLSFGNGSPDVFSNIAAFSTSTPKIGVTSILGGGLLVTTVIAASVGLASQGQDQLIPRKFMRDVGFYAVAVLYLGFVFFDGLVGLLEALGFLAIYLCYVGVILFDGKLARLYYSMWGYEYDEIQDNVDPLRHRAASYLSASSRGGSFDKSASESESLPASPIVMMNKYEVYRIPNYMSSSDSDNESHIMPTLYRKRSAPTPRTRLDNEHAYPAQSARETLPLLWRQPTLARRPASVTGVPLSKKKRSRHRSAWETTQMSAHFNLNAKRWTRGYHELSGIEEFPSVSEAGEEIDVEVETASIGPTSPRHTEQEPSSVCDRYLFAWFRLAYQVFESYIWSPLEFATTFIRRLTIPLIDDETWDKSFAMVCPPCAILMFGVTVLGLDPLENMWFAVAVVVGGAVGTIYVYFTASAEAPPEGLKLAPFICLGFGMSVVWIMNIANEVLALLKVLGGLFGISNSVLGVSVLAWGNSIGDLVSNTSIARDGFPTMAFAGCFAGPMFNLLVGLGLALTIAILSRGPLTMDKPSPLVYVSFAFLLTSLLMNVTLAGCDHFRYRPWLCYTLLCLYTAFAVISITLVVTHND